MEVIILAGGLGTRLRSEVKNVPKCMAPVADKPFLWYILEDLKKYPDVKRVILSVGYLRDVIFEWIPTVQDDYSFKIDYAIEEEPLGTGGGIRLSMEKVTDKEAIILNGDTYFAVDLNKMLAIHKANDASLLTIALKRMENFDRYGTVSMGVDGRILSFNEKRPCNDGLINGGVYVLSKNESVFEGLPKKFSFETAVLQKECGGTGCLFGVVQDGYFIDIGIPEDYHKANTEFSQLFITE